MSSIIEVKDLSKSYTISHEGSEKYTTLRDVMTRRARKLFSFPKSLSINSNVTKEEFWALKDVSFDIQKGDRVGIIGRNGAGKSTVLKILSRITEPTKGTVRIKGRVASLLEVGTGFHPELSGRENIFLNGAILGMSRTEIKKHFDAIVDFAEIEKFLDTPVKRYSSGMYVRLAFAVAAHLEPEILVVDEVLAVGDAQFQKKCLGKMQDVSKNEGRTILFVSHNMSAIQSLCTKGILLERGQLKYEGVIEDTITSYLKQFTESHRKVEWDLKKAPGNENAKLLKAEVNSFNKKRNIDFFEEADPLEFDFFFWNNREGLTTLDITFHLVDELSNTVFVGSTGYSSSRSKLYPKGEIKAKCRVPADIFQKGTYNISRLLLVQNSGTICLEVRDVIQFEIISKQEEHLGWMGGKEGIIKPKLEWII